MTYSFGEQLATLRGRGERKQSFGLSTTAELRCKCGKTVGAVLDCAVCLVLQKPPWVFNIFLCFFSVAVNL